MKNGLNKGDYNLYYEITVKGKVWECGHCLPESEDAIRCLHEFAKANISPNALLHIVKNTHKMRTIRYKNGVQAVIPNYAEYLRLKGLGIDVKLVRAYIALTR